MTKQDWEKEFDKEYYGSTCNGDGLFNSELYIDIKDFIRSLLQQAKQEGIEEVRKIVADYQGFKIDALGLETRLCEFIALEKLKKK